MKQSKVLKLVIGACLLSVAAPGLADCSYKADKEGFGLSFTA